MSQTNLFIAPTGNDAAGGTEHDPLRTLSAARDRARASAGRVPVTIHVADGVYSLGATFALTSADSGTAAAPVIYRAEHEGGAVISGGRRLELDWQPLAGSPGVFHASTPAGLTIDQLFINNQRQRMARYPNYDPTKKTDPYQGYAADAFSVERAARWADPTGGLMHAIHAHRWGGYHYLITGKNADGSLRYEGGWQNNRQMGMHEQFRMVENIREELDAPGEWYHDRNTNTLFYMPEAGVALASAVVETVELAHLIELRGSADAPVRNVSLQGFVFRHAARTFMQTREPLLRSDWTIYRGGAVVLEGCEDVGVLDCTFDQVGGNAVFVNKYNRRVRVQGCHIADCGGTAVAFVGDPEAVRNPLFEYGETNDLSRIDRTPGPKTNNYPSDSAVADCLIHGVGRVERQSAGVQISMSARITVRDTSIYDTSRSGINIGDGTWGGHVVERCDVFDTVLETDDHGSFNSWGRDRYWAADHIAISEPAVDADPSLPYLDAVEPIVLRDSRWRCDHGWDIDLDDGSSNYEIYNNLMLRGGLKLREGYGRRATNNVLVNNGLHPHVWFARSGDVFEHNVVGAAPATVRLPSDWAARVDENVFVSDAALAKAVEGGSDRKSIAGGVRFVDAATGDFRLVEGSPALASGFKNFPMDQFGVKKPSLKAIARTPIIPELASEFARAPHDRPTIQWRGLRLRAIEGEEYSAFGVAKADGGVQVIAVDKSFKDAHDQLRVNDLIQRVGGQKVTNVEQFLNAVSEAAGRVDVAAVRSQSPVLLTILTEGATP